MANSDPSSRIRSRGCPPLRPSKAEKRKYWTLCYPVAMVGSMYRSRPSLRLVRTDLLDLGLGHGPRIPPHPRHRPLPHHRRRRLHLLRQIALSPASSTVTKVTTSPSSLSKSSETRKVKSPRGQRSQRSQSLSTLRLTLATLNITPTRLIKSRLQRRTRMAESPAILTPPSRLPLHPLPPTAILQMCSIT